MKIGIRKPSLKKSLKARTTGKIKRKVKRAINPMYGKKGMGMLHPKKAVYNKVYKKTTIGVRDLANGSSKSVQSRSSAKKNNPNMSNSEEVTFDSLMSKRRWKIGWSIFWFVVGVGCISKNILSTVVCVCIAIVLLIQAQNAKSRAESISHDDEFDQEKEAEPNLNADYNRKNEQDMDESKRNDKSDCDDQEVIRFKKDGIDKLYEVVDYMKKKKIKMKPFTRAYESQKYWILEGGSSINVRDKYIHVFSTEKDREIIERCTGLKHSDNSADEVRPYAFRKLNDTDFDKVVDCLVQNENNR